MNFEWIGILGTVMVLIAFSSKTERSIRTLDIIGASFFVFYGVLTRTWSTMVLNIVLICINVYKLVKMRKKEVLQ